MPLCIVAVAVAPPGLSLLPPRDSVPAIAPVVALGIRLRGGKPEAVGQFRESSFIVIKIGPHPVPAILAYLPVRRVDQCQWLALALFSTLFAPCYFVFSHGQTEDGSSVLGNADIKNTPEIVFW